MNSMKIKSVILGLVAFAFAFAGPASAAQIASNVVVIPVTYTIPESISSALSGGTNLDLVAQNTVTLTTTYNLVAANHTAGVSAAFYFSSATAALTGPSNIGAGSVAAFINGGSAVACNMSDTGIPGSPGGLDACFNGNIVPQATVTSTPSGSKVTTIKLSNGFLGSLTNAGTWTGNLNFVSWAL
jgi:hypothetical protein